MMRKNVSVDKCSGLSCPCHLLGVGVRGGITVNHFRASMGLPPAPPPGGMGSIIYISTTDPNPTVDAVRMQLLDAENRRQQRLRYNQWER